MHTEAWSSLAAQAFAAADFAALQHEVQTACRCAIDIRLIDHQRLADPALMEWHLDQASSTFLFGRSILGHPHRAGLVRNWAATLPLLLAFAERTSGDYGAVHLSLGDIGTAPGLAFCDHRPTGFHLIPDPGFLADAAHAALVARIDSHSLPWPLRKPAAFWRGAPTGWYGTDGTPVTSWHRLPRVQLVRQSREDTTLPLDVAFATTRPLDGHEAADLARCNLLGDFVPPAMLGRYQAHIDIDGNTNAWSALFAKLASASPVLKIASPLGFRQWYYDRLLPWHHFIPVAADMSDLPEKLRWTFEHPDRSQAIGRQARALTDSLTPQAETERAMQTIRRAFTESVCR